MFRSSAAILLLALCATTHAACPSVAINSAVWVDGYHSENVLYADSNDNCAVKCSAGWLWLGEEWPNFESFESATLIGSKSDGGIYYSAEKLTSKNITCTCPPPACGTSCKNTLTVPCDHSAFICKQATPVVTNTGTCTQITCPKGTNLLSTSFESWRIGTFIQCATDSVWYGQTGWILNDTSVHVTCAVEKGGDACPKPQRTSACPNDFTCDVNALEMDTNSKGVLTLKCSQGALMIANDPSWAPMASSTLTCSESGRWYRPDGTALSSTPSATCIIGKRPPTTPVHPPPPPPPKPPHIPPPPPPVHHHTRPPVHIPTAPPAPPPPPPAPPSCQKCIHPSTDYPGLPPSVAPGTYTYPVAPIQIVDGCFKIMNFCKRDTHVMSAYLLNGTATILPVWQVDLPYYFSCGYDGNWVMGFTGIGWTIPFKTAVCANIAPTICRKTIPMLEPEYAGRFSPLSGPLVPINLPYNTGTSGSPANLCPPGYSLGMALEMPVRGVLTVWPEAMGPVQFYCIGEKFIYDYEDRCNPVSKASCMKCQTPRGVCLGGA